MPRDVLRRSRALFRAPTDPAHHGERKRLVRALAIALTSRLLCLLVAFLTATYAGIRDVAPAMRSALAEPFVHASLLARVFHPWAHWDGVWLIRVASAGYAARGTAAFFPLYPLCLRATAPLCGGNYVIAGVVLSLVFFSAACVLLFKLVSREFNPTVAFWTVVYLSVFPTSFFFQAVYTEALFLLTSVACIYWARRQRWALAGLAGMLAALTRNSGLLLAIPLVLLYLSGCGWRWRRVQRRAAWILLVPAGLALWMTYLWVAFGSPFRFEHAEGLWERRLTFPLVTLWHGFAGLADHGSRLVSAGTYQRSYVYYLAAAAVVFALVLLVVGLRRLPLAYAAYAMAAFVLPLCYPTAERPFESMPRFVLVNFPLFVVMALTTQRRRWLRIVIVALSTAGLIGLTAAFAHRYVVA